MYDFVTFGTATIDAFVQSKAFKIIQDTRFVTGEAECLALGSKVEVENLDFFTGGSALNSAATFSRQQYKTTVVSSVGNDMHGKLIENELEKERVDNFLSINKEKSTGFSVILLSSSGERTILVHRGASEELIAADVDFSKLRSKWFYLAPLSGKAISLFEKAVDFAKENHIKVALTLSKDQIEKGLDYLKSYLEKVEIIIMNREETALLTGIDYGKVNELFKSLSDHIKGMIVMTDGPNGVFVSDGKIIYKAGVFQETKVIDRTGAGDAFGSAFVAGYEETKSIEEAIIYGSANATSVVEKIGAHEGVLTKENLTRYGRLEIEKMPL